MEPQMHISEAQFTQRKNLWITVPVSALLCLFVAGLLAPEWVATSFRLSTKAEAQEHAQNMEGEISQVKGQVSEVQQSVGRLSDRFDDHVVEFRVANASAMLSALRAQRDAHEDSPENTVRWRTRQTQLAEQVRVAEEYSQCLMREQHNCRLLQGQLMDIMVNGGG